MRPEPNEFDLAVPEVLPAAWQSYLPESSRHIWSNSVMSSPNFSEYLFSLSLSLSLSLSSRISHLSLSFSHSLSHLLISLFLSSLSFFCPSLSLSISLFVDTFPRKLGLVPRFVSKANLGRDATFCRYSSTWDKEGGNCKHRRVKLSQRQTQGEKLSVTKLHQSLVRKLRDYAKTTLGQTQVEWETLQFNGHGLQSLHTSRFQASPIIVEAKVPTLSPAFSFSLSSGICLSDMFRSKEFRIV